MTRPGSSERPLRVAVVGSGPSGMYAVQALLAQSTLEVSVDVLERLPTPYGLVRYGVAPDHQKIKNVTRVYDRVMNDDRVRFLGHVEVGRDLERDDLAHCYDQIVYAVGAPTDRRLGIDGEDLPGSHSSTDFVAWYNAHPDEAGSSYPLGHREVAVIGIGNVAMDVARVLTTDPDRLAETDIADQALAALRESPLETVHVIARRGPVQAKCSPSELKELSELDGVQVVVDPADLELDPASAGALEGDKSAIKNLDLLRARAAEPVDPTRRQIRFHFLTSPVTIVGDGRVERLEVERNRLEARDGGYLASVPTGERLSLPATMVVRAIGYRSSPVLDLPFDARRGVIPNDAGRIVDGGDPVVGEYVTGWVKRGPTGLIGSNKMDSQETVGSMLEDLAAGRTKSPDHPTREAVDARLDDAGTRVVSWDDWSRIDEVERQRGEGTGRPRVKLPTVAEMLSALDA